MEEIVSQYYKESYFNGRIEKSSFDDNNVPVDTNSFGEEVDRNFEIQKENCQRAKCLSSKMQRKARIKLREQLQQASRDRNNANEFYSVIIPYYPRQNQTVLSLHLNKEKHLWK